VRSTRIAAAAGIVGLTAIVYVPALPGPFVYDDLPHIVENPALRRPGDLRGVLLSGRQGTRPVYNLSLALSAATGGLRPLPFRALNLALHLGCGALVAALAARLGAGAGAALLAAAIFLLHPVHTESVAYINSRSGLLCAFFGLGALLFAMRPGRSARAGAALLALLAVASKETGAVLPLLGWIAMPGGKDERKRAALALLPATLLLPVLFAVFPNPHEGIIGARIPDAAAHLRGQPLALLRLAGLVLLPIGQSLDHDARLPPAWGDPWFVLPAVGVIAVVCLCLGLRRRVPLLAFALGWCLVALVPTQSLPTMDLLAERHAYLASIGPIVALALAVERLATRRWFIAAPAIAVVVALAGAAAARARLWRDEVALWEDAVRKAPGKARPHMNLGAALASRGDLGRALAEFRRARAIDPSLGDALFNEGLALVRMGLPADAIEPLRRAVALHPDDPTAGIELAGALETAGRIDEALATLERAEKSGRVPSQLAMRRRAVLLQRMGRAAEAAERWRVYLRAAPRDAGAWNNLGLAEESLGRVDEARAALAKAVALSDDRRFRENLARLGPPRD
jgi:protein O-mannosyl-transferase